MKEFTVENMIQACKFEPTKKARRKPFESFRMTRFHGFIDAETFEAFCERWNNEFHD